MKTHIDILDDRISALEQRISELEVEVKVLKEILLSTQGSVQEILDAVAVIKAASHATAVAALWTSRMAKIVTPVIAFVGAIIAIVHSWRNPN